MVANLKLLIRRIFKIIQLEQHDSSTKQGQSNERFRRIFLTGASSFMVKVFSALINLLTVPLTVDYLGAERYGLWMSISSILAFMSFADLGLGNGLLNAISKAHGNNNIREAQVAITSVFFLLTGISILLLTLFLLIQPIIPWEVLFNVKSELARQEVGPTTMVLFIMFLLNMPLGVVQRIQNGYQEGYVFQLWLILGSLLSFMGLLICIYLQAGLVWLVFAFSAGHFIATLINGVVLFTRKKPHLIPKLSSFNLNTGKELIRTGLIFLALGIFTVLANSSDNIIISHTLNVNAVAGFEIVKKLFHFSMITQVMIQPLWPAFNEALVKKDYAWAKNTLNKSLRLTIISSSLISLPLFLFGKQIIDFWVGPEYTPSWSLLLGFYLFIIFANYGGVMSTFFNSGDLVSKQLIFIVLASTSSIILKIILSFNFGVSGVVWATLISYLIFYVAPTFQMTKNYFKIHL